MEDPLSKSPESGDVNCSTSTLHNHEDNPAAELEQNDVLASDDPPPGSVDKHSALTDRGAREEKITLKVAGQRTTEERTYHVRRTRVARAYRGESDLSETDRLSSSQGAGEGQMAREASYSAWAKWLGFSGPQATDGAKIGPEYRKAMRKLEDENRELRARNRELRDKMVRLEDDYEDLRARNREFRDTTKELEKQNTDLSNKNAELREIIEQHDAKTDELTKDLNQWMRYSHAQQDEINRLMRENEQLRRDLGSQRGQIDRLMRENEQLQRDLGNQRVRMQQQSAGFLRDLDAIRAEYFLDTRKIPDTTIRKDWEGLGFEIRQLVTEFLSPELEPQIAQQLAQIPDFSVLPHAEDMLQDSWLCPMWFHAWIWHVLYEAIFKAESEWWAGRHGCRFSEQYDALYREFPS